MKAWKALSRAMDREGMWWAFIAGYLLSPGRMHEHPFFLFVVGLCAVARSILHLLSYVANRKLARLKAELRAMKEDP